MKNKTAGNPNLVMNEKDMAAYLGISRYFLTELRKRHGLKCLKFKGHHCIYYYLPVVDEFFKKRSENPEDEVNAQTEDNPAMKIMDITKSPVQAAKLDLGSEGTCTAKEIPYEPMKTV